MSKPRLNLSRLKNRVIAIDGPAGSGKSTTARLLAARLGYSYLDTGAMYRALTHFALSKGVSPGDASKLQALAEHLTIEFKTEQSVNHVFINGEEVTDAIRTPEVTAHVSEVSAHKGVRQAMVAKQKEIGKKGAIVAEGRDTTTVVFPDADLKVYMDASIKQRAQRRMIDLARMGLSTTLEAQMAEIKRRDDFDSGRKHSPLTRAKDSITIDTTSMTIEEQVDRIITLLKDVLK
ncbi:MAG: (d)CMP kinase [candidate division Zixibacteria bacterium]|nr:(d)CMP kinase [candidate division Zixibacteria bacterium]